MSTCREGKPKYNPRLARQTNCGIQYDHEPTSADGPTSAEAGSMDKINVIIERLAKGQELHHPGDNQKTCSYEEQWEAKQTCAILVPGSRKKRKV